MLISWLLLITSLSTSSLSNPRSERIILSPLTKTAYLAAQKRCITTSPRLTFPVKKQGKRIVVPIASGRQVFRDALVEEDNPGWEKYTYLGYNAQSFYHFILRNHYEWSSYILLQQNGRRLDIPSEPIFSPDTSAFVVASASLGYEMMPNSLQLFRRDKEGWRQVAKVEPKMWEPAQVAWLTTTKLLLKQKRYDKDLARTLFTYAELTIH